MGGHGGLNILPQKRWNVYNYENREKVRRDEEAVARQEQLNREQSRKRDAEFRLERLRTARSLRPVNKSEANPRTGRESESEPAQSESKSNHINLFEGIKIFDPIKGLEKEGDAERDGSRRKKMKKEEVRIVTAEEEKYKFGYGVAGKGVKLPWYLEKRSDDVNEEKDEDDGSMRGKKEGKKSGKKTLQELREERLKREKQEKESARALLENKLGDRSVFRILRR